MRMKRKSREGQFWQLPNGRWIIASARQLRFGPRPGEIFETFECSDTDSGDPVTSTLAGLQNCELVRSYASRNGAARSLRRFEVEAGL